MPDAKDLHETWFWVKDAEEYVSLAIATDVLDDVLYKANLEEAHTWALRMRKKLNEFVDLLEQMRKIP